MAETISTKSAISNRVSVGYVQEATFGTTPTIADTAAGLATWIPLRITGEGLNYGKKTTVSTELRADRMVTDVIPTEVEASGDINFEWSMDSSTVDLLYASDPLLCAAIGAEEFDDNGTTTTSHNSARFNDVKDISFSFQKRFNDMDPLVAVTYKGVRIGGMSLNLSKGSIITGSYKLMGAGASLSESSVQYAAINPNTAYLHTGNVKATMGDVSAIRINKTANDFMSALTLDINNNLRAQTVIGSETAFNIVNGKIDVTGSFEYYFKSKAEYETFLTNATFCLDFKIGQYLVGTPGSHQYHFILPRCKYESVNIVAGGLDQDIIAKFNFRALSGYQSDYTGVDGAGATLDWSTDAGTLDMDADNGAPSTTQPFCILIQKVKRLT